MLVWWKFRWRSHFNFPLCSTEASSPFFSNQLWRRLGRFKTSWRYALCLIKLIHHNKICNSAAIACVQLKKNPFLYFVCNAQEIGMWEFSSCSSCWCCNIFCITFFCSIVTPIVKKCIQWCSLYSKCSLLSPPLRLSCALRKNGVCYGYGMKLLLEEQKGCVTRTHSYRLLCRCIFLRNCNYESPIVAFVFGNALHMQKRTHCPKNAAIDKWVWQLNTHLAESNYESLACKL